MGLGKRRKITNDTIIKNCQDALITYYDVFQRHGITLFDEDGHGD